MKKIILILLIAFAFITMVGFIMKNIVQTHYYHSAEIDFINATWAEKNKHIFDMASLEFDRTLNKQKANSFRVERDSLAKEGRRKTDFADKLNLIK